MDILTTFALPSTPNSRPGAPSSTLEEISHNIMTYGCFILLFLGTLGNLAALWVLRSKSFRKSSVSVSLSLLALLHLGILYTQVLRALVRGIFQVDVRSLTSLFGCKLHYFLTYYFGHLASWSLAFVVVERALVVCFHLTIKPYVSRKNSLIVWGIMAGVLFLFNFHLFFVVGLIPDLFAMGANQNTSNTTSGPLPLACFSYPDYEQWFTISWFYIDLFLLIIIPFIIIFVGNIAILREIKKALAYRAENARKRSRHDSSDGHDNGSPTHSTIMLIAVSICFLILTLPNGIYYITSAHLVTFDTPESTFQIWWLVYSITSVLYYLGTSINFLVYYISGSKFRKSCKECFSTNIFKSESNTVESRATTTTKL